MRKEERVCPSCSVPAPDKLSVPNELAQDAEVLVHHMIPLEALRPDDLHGRNVDAHRARPPARRAP